jgi:glucose-1-phosphate adenylyltransferase
MLGIINLDGEQDLFQELTYFRCGASLPYAGKYRLIDFVMSNMVHAGITDIAVFVRKKYRSLMDHLGNGREWDLDRKKGGVFILPPDWNDPTDHSKGDLQHFHNNMDFFHRGRADYVLFTDSQQICQIDFRAVLDSHIASGADVTVVYKRMEPAEEHRTCYRLTVDDHGNVLEFTKDEFNPNIFMNMYVLRKDLLLELVRRCIAHDADNFLRDGIIGQLPSLKVKAWAFDGLLQTINSVESYYKHSISLLQPEIHRELFLAGNPIYTKVKDTAPAKYLDEAAVDNSLIANGCVIAGHVENSILFRGVRVEEGATVKNSIIMQRCTLGKGAYLENVILDKDVTVTDHQRLIGSPSRPYAIPKRKTI